MGRSRRFHRPRRYYATNWRTSGMFPHQRAQPMPGRHSWQRRNTAEIRDLSISRSRTRSRRRAEDGSTMHDAVQVTAAALLGFFLQRCGCAGRAAEPAAEILRQLQPVFVRNLQPVQDGRQTAGNHPRFVFANLTSRPVEQLQIFRKRHRQTALVRGAGGRYWLGTCRFGQLDHARKWLEAASTLVEVAFSRFTSVPRALILTYLARDLVSRQQSTGRIVRYRMRGSCNRQTLFVCPSRESASSR